MYWRKVEGRKPWVLNVLMNQNSNECISMIEKNLKKLEVKVIKEFEKKRMITESEVTLNAYKGIKIDSVIETINQYEENIADTVDHKTAQHLIALYNKAVEYYSALDDERHVKYLMKLKDLMANETLQAVMEVSDVGTVDPQSQASVSVNGEP
jgi:16S rRNA U516 pseudouridylate synthase RsuA-like enzyme